MSLTLSQMKALPKEDQKKLMERLSAIRNRGKSAGYSCQYGAGPETVARTAGVSLEEGKVLHKAYNDINWSIPVIAKSTRVKTVGSKKWQFNPVNKFWYRLKKEKDRFSTLCQGTGSYIFDMWINNMVEVSGEKFNSVPPFVGQFHDECVIRYKKGREEQVRYVVDEAISRTNKDLGMLVDMACDTQFDINYAGIH